MARLKKGDLVSVLSGKDRGKTGKVLAVWPEQEKALVERVNLVKHFERRSQQAPSGGVIEREGRIALSKLALFCAKCGKASRTGWSMSQDGGKQRVCRRCQDTL